MARRWRAALPVAAVLLASTAAADYKESYKKGIEAVGRRDWPEVVRLMKEAAAEQPAEGEQVKLYGMRFETYLPHYHLGLAYFHTGDCSSALREWAVSAQQGAVKGAEKKTLLQNQTVCQTRMADEDRKASAATGLAQATAGAESELAKAEQSSRAAASLKSDQDLAPVWEQDAALRDGDKQANDALAAARAKLDQAKKSGNATLAGEAAALAAQASQLFGTLTQAAHARRDEVRAQAEAARAAAAAAAAVPTPGAPAAPEGGISPDLLAGAQAFFDARYAEAADRLARANTAGPGASHAALLRGAARFMLYVTGGQQDESLRRAAADDVRACRRLDARLSPDPAVFSPRFIEFFRQNR